jgi:hypothetical protein
VPAGEVNRKPGVAPFAFDPHKPPQTVLELLQRLFGSTQNAQVPVNQVPQAPLTTARTALGSSASIPSIPSTAAVVQPLTSPAVGLVSKAVQPLQVNGTKPIRPLPALSRLAPLPLPGTFRATELLAINLSAAALVQVKKRGFQIAGSSLSNLGLTITRLATPGNLDAVAARQLLQQEMPSETFGYNWLYRSYRSANGNDGENASHVQSARLTDGNGCSAERCYGPTLIKWRPHLSQCARNVRVGIVDTSFDHLHPTFNGRRLNVGSFVSGENQKAPNWHGTGVLSLLSGDPNSGTPGLIPDAEFYVADAFFEDDGGNPTSDTVSVAKALDWMEAWNVNVVNLSLEGPKDEVVHKIIQRLSTKKGVLFVAAAGNGGPTAPPSFPAAYAEVIAVTAVDKNMRSYRYANRGDYIDLAAPGVGIWTALPNRREGAQTGTSFAVPYVTAVIASTYKSLQKKTKAEVLERLETTDIGELGGDPIYGRGLVQAPESCILQPRLYSAAHKPVLTGPRRAEAVPQ